MLEYLKANWFAALLVPCLSIPLYSVSCAAILRHRWKQNFPWLTAYVFFCLGSLVALYPVFFLTCSSGAWQRFACLIYPGGIAVQETVAVVLYTGFAYELLPRSGKFRRDYSVAALIFGVLFLVIMLLAALEARAHNTADLGLLELINRVAFGTSSLLLCVFVPIGLIIWRRVLPRAGTLLLSAVFAYEGFVVVALFSGLAQNRMYEPVRNLAFLTFLAILYWVLRRGPEQLVPTAAAQSAAIGTN
jgi:hypothetical protein